MVEVFAVYAVKGMSSIGSFETVAEANKVFDEYEALAKAEGNIITICMVNKGHFIRTWTNLDEAEG